MTERLRSLYFHEAAHAIIAKALGSKVQIVYCRPNDDGAFYVRHTQCNGLHSDAIIGLAGAIAQERYLRENLPFESGRTSDSDITSLCDLVKHHTPTYKAAMVAAVAAKTAALVNKYWTAITKLADLIGRYQVLTGKQVDEVFKRHRPHVVYI